MTLLRPILLAAALGFAGPAVAQSVTITGTDGGTVQSDRSCTRLPGQSSCSQTTTATTATGATASRSRQRVTQEGSSTTTATTTGPAGETTTRNRKVVVSN